MSTFGDIVIREGQPTSLQGIREALGSIDGVEHADVMPFHSLDGPRVVGVVTVLDESQLTPASVLDTIRDTFPRAQWPDQVLMTYESGIGRQERRAA